MHENLAHELKKMDKQNLSNLSIDGQILYVHLVMLKTWITELLEMLIKNKN